MKQVFRIIGVWVLFFATIGAVAFGFAMMAVLEPIPLEAQAVFDAGRVTVATTATAIFTAPGVGGRVTICNRHTTPIFIGPASVTTANGFELINATCDVFFPRPRATIFGIVAAATARVDYAAGAP